MDHSYSRDPTTLTSPTNVLPSVIIQSEIKPEGGLNKITMAADGLISDSRKIFVFPCSNLNNQTLKGRLILSFVSEVFSIKEPNQSEKTLQLLERLIGDLKSKQDEICDMSVDCDSSIDSVMDFSPGDSNNNSILGEGRFGDVLLAESTPGPCLPKLRDSEDCHTPENSLRVIYYLGLSDMKARFVRGHSLAQLSTEYSWKKRENYLRGDPKWFKIKKLNLKKWFNNPTTELNSYVNGHPARIELTFCQIDGFDLLTAVKHWAKVLTETNQFVRLGDMKNCPEVLSESVVICIGDDSGQGATRECLRFVNRPNSNSGSKVFITTLLTRSDKGISLAQKQKIFEPSFSQLSQLTHLEMGGAVRPVVVFGSSDWEAGFERWGTQGASATFPNFLCNVKNQHLSQHGSSLSAHNHKTSVCVTRSKASFKNDLLGQVEGLHMGFTSLEDFESHVDLAERTEIERKMRKNGKFHSSVIGRDISGLKSVDYVCGGDVHNQIGLGNDALQDLYKELEAAKLSHVKTDIKNYLDKSKAEGGAGCTPAAHHGGAYNGKDIMKVYRNSDNLLDLVPEAFERKSAFKSLMKTSQVIFETLGVARFLSDEEISELELNVMFLSDVVHKHFKNRNITLKEPLNHALIIYKERKSMCGVVVHKGSRL